MRHILLWIATVVSSEMVLNDYPYCAVRYRRLCQEKGHHVACQYPVEWDRELAMLAQRLADQCTFVHDDCRATVRYPYAGQTVGEVRWRRSSFSDELSAQRAIRRVLDAWWGERRRVHPEQIIAPFSITPKGMSWGHFSQLAVWSLRAVGCAAVRHHDPPRLLLVCDFSHTNMLGQRTITPGPLAPCPVHSIRKPRSAFPLLCATIRFKKLPADYPFDSYDQDREDEDRRADDIVDLLEEEMESSAEDIGKPITKPIQINYRKKYFEPQMQDTTETRKMKVWKPRDEEVKVTPSEDHNKVRLSGEYYSKVRPSDEYTKVRSNEDYSKMRLNEKESEVKSSEKHTKLKPSKELRIRGEEIQSKRTNGVPFRYRSTLIFHDEAISTKRRRITLTTIPWAAKKLEILERPLKKLQDNQRPQNHQVVQETKPPQSEQFWSVTNEVLRSVTNVEERNVNFLRKSQHGPQNLMPLRERWQHPRDRPSRVQETKPPQSEQFWSMTNEELRSVANVEERNVNFLRKSQRGPQSLTSLRARWQQTRDRPSRPGANALLTPERPVVKNQRPSEKVSIKMSLKMDKEDQEQLFRDTGFKLKYNKK